MRERLDAARRENEALRIEAASGLRFDSAHEKARELICDAYSTLMSVLCDQTREYLVEAFVWKADPFKSHGPAWVPILFQKAVEYEFNEKVWSPVRGKIGLCSAPKNLQNERLSINQIRRLLQNKKDPELEDFRRVVADCTGLCFRLEPHVQKGLATMAQHSTKARHGDRSPYNISDLDVFMDLIKDGDAVFSLLALFQVK